MPQFPFFLEQASSLSGQVDLLFWLLFVLGLILVVLAMFVISGRVNWGRESQAEDAPAAKSSLVLPIVALVAALVIFGWSATIFISYASPPADTEPVYVVGRQWLWQLQHTDGTREINKLHLRVNQPVKLIMTSQDVIHSVSLPQFRVKQDMLPGEYTTLWFQPTKVGEFDMFAGEYSGAGFSTMTGKVVVLDDADYESWLAGGLDLTAPPEEVGETLFVNSGCQACHTGAADGLGPPMEGLYGREETLEDGSTVMVDEAYLEESILNASAKIVQGYQPIMPPYDGVLSEDEVNFMIAYIKSIGANPDME